jgi:hypothetical protein
VGEWAGEGAFRGAPELAIWRAGFRPERRVGFLFWLLLGLLVRPRLARRSDAVLAGQDAPRTHAHYAYVALEGAKVIALIISGILLLAS